MPERLNERKFDTAAVQGEGSWITVRAMTVGETLERMREIEGRSNVWYRIGAWFGRLVAFLLPWVTRRSGSRSNEIYSMRLIEKITAWNWVDVHGDPLPQPRDDPRVVFQLTNAELAELAECAYGARKSESLKN